MLPGLPFIGAKGIEVVVFSMKGVASHRKDQGVRCTSRTLEDGLCQEINGAGMY